MIPYDPQNLLRNGPVTDSKKQAIGTVDQIVDNYGTLLKMFKEVSCVIGREMSMKVCNFPVKHLTNPSKQSQIPVVNTARQITQLIKLLHEQIIALRG